MLRTAKNILKSSVQVSKYKYITLSAGQKQQLQLQQLRKLSQLQRHKFASEQEEGEENIEKQEEVEGEQEGEVQNEEEQQQIQEEEKIMAFSQEERIEALQRDQEILNQKMGVRIFDQLSNISKASNNRDIRNMGQADQQRYIKSKVSNLLKKEGQQSTNDISYQLHSVISSSFAEGNYQIMTEKDFRQIIFNPQFRHIIPLLQNRKFFAENPQMINNTEVAQIIDRCKDNRDLYYLLELIKYHRVFLDASQNENALPSKHFKLQFGDQKLLVEFMQIVQQIRVPAGQMFNFDVLSLYFHLSKFYSQNIMLDLSTEAFVKELANIVYGSAWKKGEKEVFRNHLHDLLFINFQATLNIHMQYFLCDVFFNQESYKKSLSAISLISLILARVQQKQNNISDLLHIFKQTFGESQFDFYLKEHLVKVLETFSNKEKANIYNQGLKLYQQQINNEIKSFKNQNLTYFDQQFFQEENQRVFYNFTNVYQSEIYRYNTESAFIFKPTQAEIEEQNRQDNSGENSQFFEKYKGFVTGNKVEVLKFLQSQLQFHGKLQMLYNNEILEKNKDNEEFLNDLLAKSYAMVSGYTQYVDVNQQRYLQRKNIPVPNEVKYQFSTINNKKQGKYLLKQSYQDSNSFMRFPGSTIDLFGLNYVSKFRFSSESNKQFDKFNDAEIQNDLEDDVQEVEKKKGDGFKEFLDVTRKIDEDKNSPHMTEEQIKSIKELQDKDIKGSQPQKVHIKPQRQQQTLKVIQDDADVRPIQQNYFQNLVNSEDELFNMIGLQRNLYELKSNNEKNAVLNSLLKQQELVVDGDNQAFNGRQVLNKLFHQPSLFQKTQLQNIVPELQERLQYQLEEENISYNYSKYIQETVFPYQLSEKALGSLLQQQQQGKSFSKKQLKRILAHVLMFNKQVSDSNIVQIVDLCEEKRIPSTLQEFTTILINNGTKISQDSFRYIVAVLSQFQSTSDSIMGLMKLTQVQYKWLPCLSLIDPYIQKLLSFNQTDSVFQIFQKTKKMILSQRIEYNNKLTSEQNLEIQEAKKIENRKEALGLYRNSIKTLYQKQKYEVSKQIFEDMVALRYELQETDYINGLYAHQQSLEQVQELYDQIKKSPKLAVSEDLLECLFNIVNTDLAAFGEFFEAIIKDFMVSGRIQFGVRVSNHVITIYQKNKNYTSFANYINFMISSLAKHNNYTKNLCNRIINESTEDLSKGYLKGLVNELFSEQQVQKIKQKIAQERKELEEKDPEEFQRQQEIQKEKVRQQRQEQFDKQKQQKSQQSRQQQQQQKLQTQQKEQQQKKQQQKVQKKQEEKKENDLEGLQENWEQSSILNNFISQEITQISNIVNKRSKRKSIKNEGAKKYRSSIEYLETGVEK